MQGVEDRLGQPFDPMAWSFSTGTGIDLTGPALIYSNSPKFAALPAFDPQAALQLEFNEPLDPATLDQSWSRTPVAWEFSPDLRMLTIRPARSWNRGENVSLNIPAADWSGNRNSLSVDMPVAFDSDPAPLALRATSIHDGQSGVPLNVVFALLFNKPVASDALRTIRLMRGSDRVPLISVFGTRDSRFTFAPGIPLSPLREYQLIVEGVQDSSGNTLSEPQTIRFTTGEQLDTTGPVATFRLLSRTAPLRVRFSKVIDVTSVLSQPDILTWSEMRGGTGYTRKVPVAFDWDEQQLLLTITPQEPLQVGIDYTLGLRGITDLAGHASSTTDFRFRPVENPDTSPPRISIHPPDGSSNVPTNAILRVMFGRRLDTPVVRLYEEDALVLTAPSQSSDNVSLQRALKPNLRYRIEVEGFRDDFDNEVPATSSTFTTGAGDDRTPLRFVSSSPAQGDAGVPPDTPWQFTFNKPLFPLVYFDLPVQSSRAFPFRYTTEVSGERLTLVPSPAWPAASTIQFSFSQMTRFGVPSLTDWAGNRLQLQVNASFRTAAINDPVPPALESANPPAGSTISAGLATVELRFSKPVIVSNAVQVFYGSQRVESGGVYSQDFRTVTFTLAPPEKSRVTLVGTDAIRDNADNPHRAVRDRVFSR